jgi:hypothetical protein
MKSKMNKDHYILIDLFNTRVLCFADYDKFLQHTAAVGGDISEDELTGSLGMAGTISYREPVVDDAGEKIYGDFFMAIHNPQTNLGTVVHEALHVSMYILDYVGAAPSVDNQEVLAYLTQYIFEKYCEMFLEMEMDKKIAPLKMNRRTRKIRG